MSYIYTEKELAKMSKPQLIALGIISLSSSPDISDKKPYYEALQQDLVKTVPLNYDRLYKDVIKVVKTEKEFIDECQKRTDNGCDLEKLKEKYKKQ